MTDIKELAQRAGFGGQQRNTLAVKLELFAKYVIAAYLAAPSSEEVREMVERLRNDETDLFRLQEQAADLIERLAGSKP